MRDIFIKSEPGPSISPSLAVEIGVFDSLVLLQIAYWIRVSGHKRKGLTWTYQSLRDLKAQFPYLGRSTIDDILHRLKDRQLILITDKHNRRDSDRTRWFALDERGLKKLTSIRYVQVKTLSGSRTTEDEDPVREPDKLSGSRTTLPTISLTNKHNVARDAGTQEHTQDEPEDVTQEDLDRFDDLFAEVAEADSSPLLPSFRKREKDLRPIAEPIDDSIQMAMYRLCFRVENSVEALILTSSQRGRVASVLGQLRDAGADFNRIHIFEAWWVKNWRSKDRATQQYQTPRPEQVLEFWVEAMKSDTAPRVIEAHKPAASGINEEALRHAMENRFKRTHE